MRPLLAVTRPVLAALLCCWLLAASLAAQQQVFPYTAYINADEVYVRSGPGQSYYPTDKLKAGQQVEVYRHDPGGWYAIRPPEGSFSWVSSRYLQAGIDDLAVVSADRVAARVGSRFSDIRDVVQVRLHEAEVVEVLEKVQSRANPQDRVWYKIAPPSGEFRWVFGKYLDSDYPRDGLRKTATTQAGAEAPGQLATDPPAVNTRELTQAQQRGYEPTVPREMSPEQYRAELEQLDLELSIMVVEEPTVWSFDEMQHCAESLLAQAQTALERGRARVLIDKISRFEDIRQRYNAIAAMRETTEQANRQLAGLHRTEQPADEEDEPGGRFDGVGELIRVVSPKVGAPRYALVDTLGEVDCYVSPAPGLRLTHYLGRRVGVTGTRGYMPEQQARHIMAKHVSALEDTRIR
jgi:uncharacterized protein YraI